MSKAGMNDPWRDAVMPRGGTLSSEKRLRWERALKSYTHSDRLQL